jgi:hypothetical protein
MSTPQKQTGKTQCESVLNEHGYRQIEALPAELPMHYWAVTPDGSGSVWAAGVPLENFGPWLRAFLDAANAEGNQVYPLDFRLLVHPDGALVLLDAADGEERFRLR